jgi:ketosteroid isomerase-like protein
MSRENVELVRRNYAYLAEHGEVLWEVWAAEIEFDATGVMPDLEVLHGRDAAGAALRAYAQTFDDFRIKVEEIAATDEEHVVTTVTDGGRMKGSGALIENRFHHVWTIRNGKVVRWSSHLSKEQALDAAGLRE